MEHERAIQLYTEIDSQLNQNFARSDIRLQRRLLSEAWRNFEVTDLSIVARRALALGEDNIHNQIFLSPRSTVESTLPMNGFLSDGETTKDALFRLSWLEQKSRTEIALLLDTSVYALEKEAKRLNINLLHARHTPTSRELRSQISQRLWQNPEYISHWKESRRDSLGGDNKRNHETRVGSMYTQINVLTAPLRDQRVILSTDQQPSLFAEPEKDSLFPETETNLLFEEPKNILEQWINADMLSNKEISEKTGWSIKELNRIIRELDVYVEVPASYRNQLYRKRLMQEKLDLVKLKIAGNILLKRKSKVLVD